MTQDADMTVLEAARHYLGQGWFPVPLPPRTKGAVLKGWPQLRLTEAELPKHFSNHENIGLILGEPSGWLVDVDLDCPEAVELADKFLPPTDAVTGRPSAPRSHRWYMAEGAVTVKHQDPHSGKMIVELRSTGGQTVVGPSVHPEGETYDVLAGDPACVSRELLELCVAGLAQAVCQRRQENVPAPGRPAAPRSLEPDDFDLERRAIAYLGSMPPAISGSGGHAATYAAAVALVHGFGIDPDRALGLLATYYNPRCNPPWTEKELRHKVDDAFTKPHSKPYGWLRDERTEHDADVDLSRLTVQPAWAAKDDAAPKALDDPGPTPERLLDVPGFVHDVMQYTLESAAYPDQAMAFAGALSLQALLAGRKVRDSSDIRTNLYIVALANSGAGKDAPRKTNEKILLHADMAESIGDEIGSAEGMLDDLEVVPSLLFQTDEIDFLMQAMNQPKESRYQRIMQALLKLFTSANGLYAKRKKVGKERGYIDQPCVCLYGTAIPDIFYKTLSMKMLTNGWFARLLIVETPRRGKAREDEHVADVPQHILSTAQWWVDYQPGEQRGNLQQFHPTPVVIESTAQAKRRLREFRRRCDEQYRTGEATSDQATMAIWARAVEKARKLALLFACSENHAAPNVSEAAMDWACQLIEHQTRRMLFMAGLHVADSDFEARCKQVLEVLAAWRQANGDEWMKFRDVSRKLRWSRRDHDEIRQSLLDQELIEYAVERTGGPPRHLYRLK